MRGEADLVSGFLLALFRHVFIWSLIDDSSLVFVPLAPFGVAQDRLRRVQGERGMLCLGLRPFVLSLSKEERSCITINRKPYNARLRGARLFARPS